MKKEILENVSISDIKEYVRNPRVHNMEAIKRSIEKNGFRGAILVDENNIILAGHGRFKALKELGWDKIPIVIKYSDLTIEQKKDFRVRDNKTTELADWKMDILVADFNELELKDFGFDILREIEGIGKMEEVGIEFEVNREMDFIVIFCDSETDFVFLCDKFGLKRVKHPKNKGVGVGRLVSAKTVMELMK